MNKRPSQHMRVFASIAVLTGELSMFVAFCIMGMAANSGFTMFIEAGAAALLLLGIKNTMLSMIEILRDPSE